MSYTIRDGYSCLAHPLPLILTTLKYLCINHGDQRVLEFAVIINILVSSFLVSKYNRVFSGRDEL